MLFRAPIEKETIQRIHLGKDAPEQTDVEMAELQLRRSKDLDMYNVMPEEIISVSQQYIELAYSHPIPANPRHGCYCR